MDGESVLRNNLTAFLPYISQCVDANDILAYMTCFTREERKNIIATSLENKIEAAHTALNVILSKSEEGLFFEFKEAMEHAGYPKIVKMLCGEHVGDDAHFQRLINLFTETLVKYIRPMELLPHLLQSRVLLDQESEDIRSEEMNHGSMRACWILLFHLPRRVEDWFTLFMKALVESNHGEAAELIDPDLFKKLKAQAELRRKESQAVPTVEEVLVGNEQAQRSHEFEQTIQPGPAHKTVLKQAIPEDDCKLKQPGEIIYSRVPQTLAITGFGNDLNVLEEKILNTDTDLDEIPPEKNEEELFPKLRGYQKEVAREGADGENTIVLAPTNTGKTWVACYIIQEHLRRCVQAGRNGKVVFIVDNEALAIQQGNLCTENLPAHRTKVITGSTQRDKGQYLRDFVNRRDILVVTAMVLVNSLREREIADLTTFSLLLMDECHHSNDNHPYNQILKRYRRLKLLDQVDLGTLPQVVGLTASLGVGGHTNIDKAIDHMKQIMANMDAKFLSIVRSKQGLDEMKEYENPPDEEIVTAPRRQYDTFEQCVVENMDTIDATIQTHPSILNLQGKDNEKKNFFRVPDCKGSEQFIQWVTKFKKVMVSLNSMEARTFLDPCRQHLEVYNKALMIHKDARVVDALKLLSDFMEDELERQIRPESTQIEDDLLALYTELAATDYGTVSENPKLLKMQDLLLSNLGDGENSRGIIFVRTKELVNALVGWMNEIDDLKHLNADKFVGKNASASSGGMTRSGQGDALQYFKDGRHKVIVATSVAEEGLDITKCNLVIRYEHVTNEIVRVQSKGRARARNSRYYVLTEEGSWITAKEEKNAMLEDLMKRLVPRLHRWIAGNTNEWEEELRRLQEEMLNAERLAEQKRAEAMSPDQMQLQCVHCSNFICMSDELRKVQNAHHIVVADDIMKRVVAERSPIPQFAEDDIQMDGDVYCMECLSRLGGVLSYKSVEFPLLVIANFRVVDKNGLAYTAKKWKKVNFRITPFTLDDLEQILIKKLQEE